MQRDEIFLWGEARTDLGEIQTDLGEAEPREPLWAIDAW